MCYGESLEASQMVREKRTYQLWERPPHSPSWHGLWHRHRFAVLFSVSVFASLIVGGWVNHPWFHLLEILVLVDLTVLQNPSRWGGHQATVLVLMHALAGLSISVGTIWMESALTGVSGLFLILLILFPRKQRGGR